MRWDTQKVTDGAGPALLPLKGLVRSVRTPEFEGVTFHEVLCKSALNRVPKNSSMPFAWTINPTRGCLHQCVYCLSPDTLVLMAEGFQKPIGELTVGERIVGTRLEGQHRRYVETAVQATWRTRKRAYRVTLRDGTEIVASGDHRFLTGAGWTHVAPASGSKRRAHLTVGSTMMGCGSGPGPKHARGAGASEMLDVIGGPVQTSGELGVVKIEDLGTEDQMVDITTGTGDFIANGAVSHNCFARKTHEYLDLDSGADFDSQIVVKTNVVEVLRAELSRPSWAREHVALGTNSDPYMRAEGRYRLMPGIIEALAEARTPFSILTKGPLLKRDLPLLVRAAEQVNVDVGVSLAFMDDDLQQRVEPGTPKPAARLQLVRALADAGLAPTVMAMPVLPWLTDSEAHLDALMAAVAEAGGAWVTVGALHLRPGAREWFLAWLGRDHPELVPRYEVLYGGSSYASAEYREWLAGRVRRLRKKHGFVERPTRGGGANGPGAGQTGRWSLRSDPAEVTARPGMAEPARPGLSELGMQPALF